MALLVCDTPPLPSAIICHRNRTPWRNAVHKTIQDTQVAVRAVSEAATHPRAQIQRWWVGVCVVGVERGTAYTDMHTERRRERGGVGGVQAGRRLAYRSLQLQHRRFSRLVLKDALGLGAVLPGVHLFIRGLPLVPVWRRVSGRGGVWDRREPILIK